MADEVTTGEETKETTETETEVDVTQMDDAALDAQLAADDDGTPAQTDEEKPETETQTETKSSEVQAEPPETADEEKARLEKQVKAKEEFIGRQSAEIGDLRKQAQQLQEQLAAVDHDELNARYNDDPAAVVNEVLAARQTAEKINHLNMLANIKQNEVIVKEYVPDFDDLMDDMVETLKELKYYDDEIVRNFRTNPYAEQPAIVVNLAARALLAKENKALKAEIEGLKQKVRTGPEDALKKVEKAARQVVTGATGKSGGAQPAKGNITQMTAAQLDEILNGPDED